MIQLLALAGSDVLMALVLALRYSTLPPQIPLFYSLTWGESQLADWWYIFLLPIMLHVFVFVNRFISFRFFLADPIVKQIFEILNWVLIVSLTFLFIRVVLKVS